MKSKKFQYATVAWAMVLALVCFHMFRSEPAWAIEQTIKKIKNINTIFISGTTIYDGDQYLPFQCWIKLDDKDGNLLMRFESDREKAVVQGDTVYCQKPDTTRVKIYKGSNITNLKFWYQAMELSPWLSGKILQTLKPLADNWQEEYGKNEKTGRDSVFVTCGYNRLKASFWFIFDIESKLIVEAKHWSNPHREGTCNLYADTFQYNVDIPDEIFEFEIPDDAQIVYQNEDQDLLLEEAQKKFDNKEYTEALEMYIQADYRFMQGICYINLGQYNKAIETLTDVVASNPESSAYFYLGIAYEEKGDKDKALEAYKNCLETNIENRKPNQFPLKEARERVDKLQNN